MKPTGWVFQSCWSALNDSNGQLTLSLTNNTAAAAANIRVCFTSQLISVNSASIQGGRLALTDGGYHEIVRLSQQPLTSGEAWTVVLSDLRFKPSHANDGPIAAFVIIDGSRLVEAHVIPMRCKSVAPVIDDPGVTSNEPIDSCLGVIPYPNSVALSPGQGDLPDTLILNLNCSEDVVHQFDIVKDTFSLLFPDEPMVFSDHPSSMPVDVIINGNNPESYEIQFEAKRISICAGALSGVFYAALTLYQIIRAARFSTDEFIYPNSQSRVSDNPRFGWRGAHLDVARRFYSVADVKRFISICAWYKLNRFHWHLSDDEGWRVEIKAYPELTEIGSKRGYGHPIPPQFNDTSAVSGGYYTQEDILDIVAFASDRHVEIMPEIDMPAHSTATLRSLPWLVDSSEEPNSYVSVHGFHNNALNPALAKTEQFVKTVIDELVPLFPFGIFHAGGDEVADLAWHCSDAATSLARRLDKPATSGLHAYFVGQLQKLLSKHDKTMGLWDDGVSEELDPENAMVFAWRDTAIGTELAKNGFNVVLIPGQHYYLDMARSDEWSEPGASWAGSTSTLESYSFDVPTGPDKTELFSGIQCGIWSEHMANEGIFNYLVYPRLLAVAESGWTPTKSKSWARFNAISTNLPAPWQIMGSE